GVGRADRLRHHVGDTERLEHGAHRAAGDDAGAGRGRAQIDATGAMTAGDVVMQRTAFAQRHAREIALGRFRRLADRLGHFARLAVAEPGPALLVADHDQRRKAEALAALDDLCHAIDVDQLVDELAVALLAIPIPVAPAAFTFTCHGVFQSFGGFRLCPRPVSLEAQSAFARGIRERLDTAVIEIAAAIEHDFLDAILHRALREQLAHGLRSVDVGAGLLAHFLFQ